MVDNDTVLIRDASLSKFSTTKLLSNWHPITGLLALFSAFGSPMQPIIGEQFLSTEHDFDSKTLPEGVVWASNNGGHFNIEIVKQVFASRPVSLGNGKLPSAIYLSFTLYSSARCGRRRSI